MGFGRTRKGANATPTRTSESANVKPSPSGTTADDELDLTSATGMTFGGRALSAGVTRLRGGVTGAAGCFFGFLFGRFGCWPTTGREGVVARCGVAAAGGGGGEIDGGGGGCTYLGAGGGGGGTYLGAGGGGGGGGGSGLGGVVAALVAA
jgi:hypothetical protein